MQREDESLRTSEAQQAGMEGAMPARRAAGQPAAGPGNVERAAPIGVPAGEAQSPVPGGNMPGNSIPASPPQVPRSASATGATEEQVDRSAVTPAVTDMGLDALGRDEPDKEGFGRGEPNPPEHGLLPQSHDQESWNGPDPWEEQLAGGDTNVPGYSRPPAEETWNGADTDAPQYGRKGTPGLGGARPPDPGRRRKRNFETKSRLMVSPPDADANTQAPGGPGYESGGSTTNARASILGHGAAQGKAGAGPIGGRFGRGDTPDAIAARREYGMRAPDPDDLTHPLLGVDHPRVTPTEAAPPDEGFDGAGAHGSTSGGGFSLASHAAEEAAAADPRPRVKGGDTGDTGDTGDIAERDRNPRYGRSGKMGLGGAQPAEHESNHESNEEQPFYPTGSHAPDEANPLGAEAGSGVPGDSSGPDLWSAPSGPLDAPPRDGILTAADLDEDVEHPIPMGSSPATPAHPYMGSTGGLGGGDTTGILGEDVTTERGAAAAEAEDELALRGQRGETYTAESRDGVPRNSDATGTQEETTGPGANI